MNILVLNGSPKGEYSITLQTVYYIAQQNSQDSFEVLHVGQKIRRYEEDFTTAADKLQHADLILFSYPVYTFLAPSQLHRFVELMKENGLTLHGKYAAQITTSKHFYDITAHRYIQDICGDLGLHYIGGLSADMDDLLHEKGQRQALDFWQYVSWCAENGFWQKPLSLPPSHLARRPVHMRVQQEAPATGRVVIVADLRRDDIQLRNMIERFTNALPICTELVNIREFPFQGGCLSCFNCATSGKCIYKDRFDDFLRDRIQAADAIVIAFRISDHSMGARFKMYDDRQFCNGHRTVTAGMPFAYLISGDLSREENLRTVIDARAQVGGNWLAGIAADETNPDAEIDNLAIRLEYAIRCRYTQPSNFWGVGGMKIFRDLIWQMQGMMKADHRFYKEHGLYDFPQKHRGTMLKMYLVGALIGNEKVRKKMGNKMSEGMIAPYRKVLKKQEKKK